LIWFLTLAWAADFDHTHSQFAEVLAGAVTDAGVDYAKLGARRGILDAYLMSLATADMSTFDDKQKLALWVNAYNAHTVTLILDNPGILSIMELDGGNVWKERVFAVAGQQVTLNDMEHEHARKLADGRVHAVVNCASKGCPPLPPEPVVSTELPGQLDEAAERWARTNAWSAEGDTVFLSKIFDWYGDDFLNGAVGKEAQAVKFLQNHVNPNDLQTLTGASTYAWQEYDWSLNASAQ
jgi:hypothetical protein